MELNTYELELTHTERIQKALLLLESVAEEVESETLSDAIDGAVMALEEARDWEVVT